MKKAQPRTKKVQKKVTKKSPAKYKPKVKIDQAKALREKPRVEKEPPQLQPLPVKKYGLFFAHRWLALFAILFGLTATYNNCTSRDQQMETKLIREVAKIKLIDFFENNPHMAINLTSIDGRSTGPMEGSIHFHYPYYVALDPHTDPAIVKIIGMGTFKVEANSIAFSPMIDCHGDDTSLNGIGGTFNIAGENFDPKGGSLLLVPKYDHFKKPWMRKFSLLPADLKVAPVAPKAAKASANLADKFSTARQAILDRSLFYCRTQSQWSFASNRMKLIKNNFEDFQQIDKYRSFKKTELETVLKDILSLYPAQ